MFNSFVIWPAGLVFLIYSIGAMILLGDWQIFLWGVAAFLAGFVFEVVLAILTE